MFFFALFFTSNITAQNNSLKKANEHFEKGEYRDALIYLNRIEKIANSGPLLYKRAISYYHTNQLDRALSDFRRSYDYGYQGKKTDLFLGLIRRDRGNFEQAAVFFKKYLNQIEEDDKERYLTRNLIKQCGSAIKISYQRPKAIVENGPASVNTVYNDFGMIESPSTEGRFFFNSTKPLSPSGLGKIKSQIYQVSKKNDQWEEPSLMTGPVNSHEDNVVTGFTIDGNGIFVYRGTSQKGEFLQIGSSTDQQMKKDLNLPANLGLTNSSAFVFDHRTIIYADNREGGYGGYDLYIITKKNGKWSQPLNMGPTVNTSHDEKSPYLTNDGRVLYFSSDRPQSVGGFDVFSSVYQFEQGEWSFPENMGIPINSPGNETDFRLVYDGLSAYFTSDRKTARGGQDIFVARFTSPQEGQEVFTDDLPFVNREPLTIDEGSISQDTLRRTEYVVETIQEETITKKPLQYLFVPIIFEDSRDLFKEKNLRELNRLVGFLDENKGVLAEINAHSTTEGILEYNLFSSYRVAKRAKEYLVSEGIASERIIIKGLGDSYPLIKSDDEEGDPVLADKMNARLELRLHHAQDQPIELTRKEETVSPIVQDMRFQIYEAIVNQSLSYRIQIATVNQMYRGVALGVYNDASIEEQQGSGLLAYTIGLYDNYAEALQTRRNLEQDGLTDAKVIAYIDGLRVPEEEIIFMISEYPDLKDYLNYERQN